MVLTTDEETTAENGIIWLLRNRPELTRAEFALNTDAGGRTFAGILDEMRLSSVARSDGWLVTQFRNQSSPSTFYTVSAPL